MPHKTPSDISPQALKTRLRHLGLTQQGFATKTGLSLRMVQAYCREDRRSPLPLSVQHLLDRVEMIAEINALLVGTPARARISRRALTEILEKRQALSPPSVAPVEPHTHVRLPPIAPVPLPLEPHKSADFRQPEPAEARLPPPRSPREAMERLANQPARTPMSESRLVTDEYGCLQILPSRAAEQARREADQARWLELVGRLPSR
jgi:transcriptional regulator with XRE-family HTH domain